VEVAPPEAGSGFDVPGSQVRAENPLAASARSFRASGGFIYGTSIPSTSSPGFGPFTVQSGVQVQDRTGAPRAWPGRLVLRKVIYLRAKMG